MIVPLVQPLKNVEDEAAVKDNAYGVSHGVGHALHLATIVAHQEVALHKVTKCGIEV
jgi:hypothetical protein